MCKGGLLLHNNFMAADKSLSKAGNKVFMATKFPTHIAAILRLKGVHCWRRFMWKAIFYGMMWQEDCN